MIVIVKRRLVGFVGTVAAVVCVAAATAPALVVATPGVAVELHV